MPTNSVHSTPSPRLALPLYPAPRRLVVALTIIYAYAFADRVILALLVDPIRAELHITDVQISLLLGLAFAAIYCAANLPAGIIADRVNRRALIAIGSVGWAATTIASAFAANFTQLFVARAGVGLAEAVVGPAVFSLIRTAIPENNRGIAFSVYAMAPMIGGTVALAGGGLLLQAAHAGLFHGIAILSGRSAWRVVLLVVGAAGLPLSLLLLLFPEPARPGARSPVGSSAAPGRPLRIGEAVAHVRAHAGSYAALIGFATYGAMMAFGQSAWLPAMLSRRWAVPLGRLGPILGLITLLCGLAGLSISGAVMARLTRQGGDVLLFGAIAVLFTAFGLAGAALAPSFTLALVFAAIGLLFVGISYPVGATVLARVTPAWLMGTITAGYLLVQTLLGQALGPTLIALTAQRLLHGPRALTDAFALIIAAFGLGAAACAWTLRGPARWRIGADH